MYTYPVQNNEQQVYGVIAYIKDVTEKNEKLNYSCSTPESWQQSGRWQQALHTS
ncbi:hypothetical protein GCM10020331_028360 [Ectobacillus funiculus]